MAADVYGLCLWLIFVIFAAVFCQDLNLLSLKKESDFAADFVPLLKQISKTGQNFTFLERFWGSTLMWYLRSKKCAQMVPALFWVY